MPNKKKPTAILVGIPLPAHLLKRAFGCPSKDVALSTLALLAPALVGMGKELALPAALALLAAEDADAWALHSLTLSHSVFQVENLNCKCGPWQALWGWPSSHTTNISWIFWRLMLNSERLVEVTKLLRFVKVLHDHKVLNNMSDYYFNCGWTDSTTDLD